MRLFYSGLIIFLFTQSIVAQNNTSSVYRFLNVTPTARAAGLGGGHAGLYNSDFSLININPAYLTPSDEGKISVSFINFLGEANLGFTSTSFRLDSLSSIGAAIRYVGYGEFDHLDENGNELGSFSPHDISLTGVYSYRVTKKLVAAAGLDLIHSSYAGYKSSAVAISGGVFFEDSTRNFSAGLAIRNLGTQLKAYDELQERLPLDVSVGVSKKPEGFPFQLNLTFRELNNWDMRVFGESKTPPFFKNVMRHVLFGGEALFSESFSLRLGYDHYLHEQAKAGETFDFAGVAIGIGFKVKKIIVDISRNSYSKLGGITQISVKTDFLR